MKKICAICGKEYEGNTSSKYCSEECRKVAIRKYVRKYQEKNKDKIYAYNKQWQWRNYELKREIDKGIGSGLGDGTRPNPNR